MPPKLSLISLVCPEAPFLVPLSARRALRATERRLWPLVISNTYASHAAVSRRPSKFLYRVKREKANADKRFTFPQRSQEVGQTLQQDKFTVLTLRTACR